MGSLSNYLKFVKEKGRPLSELNPGSDEIALSFSDALEALSLLKNDSVKLLGGDILSEDNGKLIYAYQLWGSEYHSLNWYCDKEDSENDHEYLERSLQIAEKAVKNACEIAKKMDKECYIVYVTE